MKVLIADDEKSLVAMLKEMLRQNNIDSDAVYNGSDALDYAQTDCYDLIILDIMMPKLNGLEVIKQIRDKKISTPILFLSAKSQIDDKVQGLNLGADDYLTKPFAESELIARVRALSRRTTQFISEDISFYDISLIKSDLILRSRHNQIRLGATEYKIMEILIRGNGTIIEKESLIVKVWGYDNEAEYNNAEVYISFLRKKLAAIKSGVIIKAVRGVGYRLIGNIDEDN